MKRKLTIFKYKKNNNFFLLFLSVFFFSISYGQNATITIDLLGITNSLQEAQFSEVLSEDKSIVVQLPYDGQGKKNFYVVQNNVIGENLQTEYPNIKSYSVQMVDDSGIVGAVTISPYGFFANYLVGGNLIGIRPVDFTNPYIHEVEIGSNTPFPACGVTSEDQENNLPKIGSSNFETDLYKSGTTSYTNAAGEVLKRKYDMVVAATGEFTTANAYEIASGTTIMSYNGICGAGQNIPGNGTSDNYFHAASISQMTNYANSVSCQTDCPTGNYPPEVDADPCGAGTIDIPIGTPFKLLGSATDADGDALTYTWEQLDEDGAGTPTQGATLTQVSTNNGLTAGVDPLAPLFQSHPPSPDPCRYFPDLIAYKSDVNTIGTEFEVLPQVPRTLTFALTVRDCNANGGGTACELQTLNVINGGPLVVESPCAGGYMNYQLQLDLVEITLLVQV